MQYNVQAHTPTSIWPMASAIASHPKPTVFIVDDDAAMRDSLEALVELSGWEPRVFAFGEMFLASPPAPGPSCLVLGANLPDLDVLDLQKRVASERREMPVIFVAGGVDVPMIVRAMKAGAAEFLTKPCDDDDLFEAMDAALSHSRAAAEEQAALRALCDRYASLTRRECDVMGLVVAGLLNKQVGGELGISEITVKAHRGRVMEKMNARSFAALVKMGEKLGLASPLAR